MSEPDSEVESCSEISVYATPERDWPKFGAVTVSLARGNSGNVFKLSKQDARRLSAELLAHLSEQSANSRRRSSTTGRDHECPQPEGQECYWSGDPYAPHGIAF